MPVLRAARPDPFQPASLRMIGWLAVLSLALFLLVSCRMDYGKSVDARSLETGVPDLVVVNSQIQIIRDDSLLMTLDVEKAETFNQAGNRNMEGVKFTQFNSDGSVAARGTAGKAVQLIQSDDVHFTDGLSVEIVAESAKITAAGLDWTAKDKVLRGFPGQEVEISKQDGSRIKGYGLFVDLGGRTIELDGGVEGLIINE